MTTNTTELKEGDLGTCGECGARATYTGLDDGWVHNDGTGNRIGAMDCGRRAENVRPDNRPNIPDGIPAAWLALYLDPEALRDHFDGYEPNPVEGLDEEALRVAALTVIGWDSTWEFVHGLMQDIIDIAEEASR